MDIGDIPALKTLLPSRRFTIQTDRCLKFENNQSYMRRTRCFLDEADAFAMRFVPGPPYLSGNLATVKRNRRVKPYLNMKELQ